MFLSPWFAVAGLIAAAGPVIIHLLNRQRYRVIEWAAMDFLRQAVRRSRRILRIRDLLLLVLRTAIVLLFGLAMARPFFSAAAGATAPNQPVHAVLLVDNSLSMAYTLLDGTLLDTAKRRARQFIERLPPGSRVSVLPLASAAGEYSVAALAGKEEALEVLDSIDEADRSMSVAAAADLALDACRRVSSPAAKQIVLFTDQQASNWPADRPAQLDQLPAPLEIDEVSPGVWENAWIADFHLQDAVADLGTPATFLATVHYEGPASRADVQVTLTLDGVAVASQTVELQPGQSREIQFADCTLAADAQPGRPAFVAAEVSLPPDRLPADDRRVLIAPVVAGLPVVFVDQHGADEDPGRDRIGETYRLRRLFAPITVRADADQHLVDVRHVQIDQLDRDLLQDVRLVVVAGIADPSVAVPLLREYVEQGGTLLLAAGADFDPSAWTASAWLDGLGILPAPLKGTVGALPSSAAGKLAPFQLDVESMVHDYFLLEQTSRAELEDLYRQPWFFKAVEPDLSATVVGELIAATTRQLDERRRALGDADARLEALAELEVRRALSDAERAERDALERRRAAERPAWLRAGRPPRLDSDALAPAALAERSRPRVLASFTNKVPFLLEREIGAGRVLFVTSGVYRDWNTLTATHAVVLFDRIFRHAIEETLPQRNIASTGRLVLPVPPAERQFRFTLTRPDGKTSPLAADALTASRYGLRIEDLTRRGLYHVIAEDPREGGGVAWEATLAVNGPADESNLAPLAAADIAERMSAPGAAAAGTLRLGGMRIQGQDLWKALILAVLAGLLLELLIAAGPTLLARRQT